MSAAKALEQIRQAIINGLVDSAGTEYDDPETTLATIEDILNDNPVEYKYRVVNKPLFKSHSYNSYEEAVGHLMFDGDSLQRRERGNGWEDI